jgi:hypothetical protein
MKDILIFVVVCVLVFTVGIWGDVRVRDAARSAEIDKIVNDIGNGDIVLEMRLTDDLQGFRPIINPEKVRLILERDLK